MTANASLLASVKARLRGVKGPDSSGWYTAFCPFHEDREHPNLRFTENGFKCLACGEKGNIGKLAEKLGIATPEPFEDRIETTYDYLDEQRTLLYQVVRLHSPKDFRQRRPDGNGRWHWNLDGVRRVPYRLPELLAADRSKTLFVVEGERDVDRLISVGLVATTNPGGAGKWKREHNRYLKGRKIIILPDNDDVGRNHARQVARTLCEVAGAVRILNLPDLPDKGDVSDWFGAGGTADELRALASAAPIWSPMVPAQTGDVTESAHPFPRTDAGNGELFAHCHGDHVRYDHRRRRWLIWGGHWWRPDADSEVRRLAKATARKRYDAAATLFEGLEERKRESTFAIGSENRQRLDAMLAQAQTESPIADAGDGWDSDPWVFGATNGVVDLRAGRLREGQCGDRVTLHSEALFDQKAICPRWDRFLQEVFGADRELIDFIARAVGYSLTGDASEQCLFMCHGSGANGKSVFLTTLRAVAGSYAYNSPFSTFELAERSSIPNDLAALVGKRLVTASETNEAVRLNEARLKALTGGDPVTARFLHGEFFTFQPVCKLWLAVNHRPRVGDDSYGFWRRVRLIPFTRRFTDDADRHLAETLRTELPGILNWAVRGALTWQEEGLEPPKVVQSATEDYRVESDPLAEFIEERCAVGTCCVAAAGQLYEAYRQWASDQGMREREVLSTVTFGRRMSERFEKRHTRAGKSYHGVGLLSDRSVPEQQP
jgi:putative DNA primase/helicase